MTKFRRPPYSPPLRSVSPIVTRTIREYSEDRRDSIRGAVAEARRGELLTSSINTFRNNNVESDMVAAATILESPSGLRKRAVTGLAQRDLPIVHDLKVGGANLEAAYICGFLNAWKNDSLDAIDTIARLASLARMSKKDAIAAVRAEVQKWGASNYIARKIAYMKEFFDLDQEDSDALEEVDDILGHRESPAIQSLALENVMERISLFSIARRYTNILADHVNEDYHRWISLNNLIATPFSHDDSAGFLLRAVETSLVDAVFSVLVILNLKERFVAIVKVIENHLLPEILHSFRSAQTEIASIEPPVLSRAPRGAVETVPEKGAEEINRSLSLYRQSAGFLEYDVLCRYRNDIDRVVGHRLIAPLLTEIVSWHSDSFYEPHIMRRDNAQFDMALHNDSNVSLDNFYRTYLFLRFIQDPGNLSMLGSDDIQYIFDNTMRLETLLLERELKTMHLNASDEARALISVLALSLYRSKSSDPDIDFDFRAKLEDFIIKKFHGKIPAFIDHLAPKSPEVANYIATSLDEVTLQKMYSIITSPSDAENTRRDILTSIGVHLNRLEYIIEAEAIETRSKVSKLKHYFDASRMFVDSVVMKKWLSSNPSGYTEQYKELLPKVIDRLAASSFSKPDIQEAANQILEITAADGYLVEKIATEAFRAFCTNNEFGIESYLGRRIRHNTLQGVMTKSIDAVTQRPEYSPIISGTPFGRALHAWETGYKSYIERMRREFLQFRSDTNPNALFNAEMDLSDPATKSNVQKLAQTLRVSGAEMLDDLIISFCWLQIAPQLEVASRQIRVKMATEVTQGLDQTLQRFNGSRGAEAQICIGQCNHICVCSGRKLVSSSANGICGGFDLGNLQHHRH